MAETKVLWIRKLSIFPTFSHGFSSFRLEAGKRMPWFKICLWFSHSYKFGVGVVNKVITKTKIVKLEESTAIKYTVVMITILAEFSSNVAVMLVLLFLEYYYYSKQMVLKFKMEAFENACPLYSIARRSYIVTSWI